MEKKEVAFEKAISGGKKSTARFFERAKNAVVNAVDQNGDGKLDVEDITVVTDSMKAVIKENSDRWNERQEQKRREKELEELKPVFLDDIDDTDFALTKLIRITEMDKKHAESEVCQNSIGFYSETKELRFLNIYRDSAASFGLSFYPNMESEIYYVDPTDRDHYIALDSYFTYLKMARSNELQRIAQDLGAKHFRVTLMEEKKEALSSKVNIKAGFKTPAKQGGNLNADHESGEKSYMKIGIAAELDCPGHEPVQPKLVYLQKDLNVQNLIELRMARNTLTHQKVSVSFMQSSGIKVKDAIKIDEALNALKIDSNMAVTKEAEKETRRLFEYEIDF